MCSFFKALHIQWFKIFVKFGKGKIINKYNDINPAFEKLGEETVHNPPFSTDSLGGGILHHCLVAKARKKLGNLGKHFHWQHKRSVCISNTHFLLSMNT